MCRDGSKAVVHEHGKVKDIVKADVFSFVGTLEASIMYGSAKLCLKCLLLARLLRGTFMALVLNTYGGFGLPVLLC